MNVNDLLQSLSELKIQIRADGNELAVRGNRHALTDEIRAGLTTHKQALLGLLRQQHDGAQTGRLEVDREHRHEPFLLTDIQQAYWIGRTAAVDLGQVGCHYYQEFEGPGLDVDRLERAFQQLVERHDMLRAFVEPDGKQRILAETEPYRFGRLDLRTPDPTAASALLAVREQMSGVVFDPGRWPVFEVRVSLLPAGRVRTHLSFDLLLIDAMSLSLMLRDWEALYRGVALPPIDLSFRDYVLAEQAQRSSERYRRAVAYWEQRLASLPPSPALPKVPDAVDSEVRSSARRRRKGTLAAPLWAQLRTRASEHGLTPSSLVCSAFAEVLGTWSANDSFTLNLTFCSRLPMHPQVDLLVGDFTTTILLEVNRSNHTFVANAAALHARLTRDMDHIAVSGVEVMRRLRRAHRTQATALMPVVFTSLLGDAHGETSALFAGNWLGEVVFGVSQTPQVSLDHQAFQDAGALAFHWDTAGGHYPEETLDAMFETYRELLHTLAQEDRAWREPAMTVVPRDQLRSRAQANATTRAPALDLLHAPFVEQARREPDRVGLITPARTFTYGELERRSASLAHELRRRGAAPNELVAVVMHKGWEQIIAVLAILRAGAAYLPIDVALPPLRIRHLLDRGHVRTVLVQSGIGNEVGWPESVARIAVDVAEDEASGGDLDAAQTLDDLAYTIFTSGSTGQPKGVMISHRSVANTVADVNARIQLAARDRILGLSSLSFDLSVYDVFGTLGAGAALVLPAPDAGHDPDRWAHLIGEHRVTVWNSVPALLQLLVEYCEGGHARDLTSLRVALLSGDWIPVTLPGRVRRLIDGISLVSMGGATEASIWSIWHQIDRIDEGWASIPYGRPMANQSFHVVDGGLRPCPVGVPGELLIGGAGLAQGYLGDPEETRRRFVVQPTTGERLYRTGDLGQYLPSGDIELLGRLDFQVKIQGHRIELGEIESVLALHPAVRAAVAVALADDQGERRLVAYVTRESTAPDVKLEPVLLEALRATPPAYMVPAVIVELDALPLTSNGKVDRTSLPPPERPTRAAAATAGVPGDGDPEVARIVSAVMGVDDVGPGTTFVELACTSLHLVQIHQRLSAYLGKEFPVAEMFNHPTVASLAQALRAPRADEKQPAGSEDHLRLERASRNRAQAVQRRKSREPVGR